MLNRAKYLQSQLALDELGIARQTPLHRQESVAVEQDGVAHKLTILR